MRCVKCNGKTIVYNTIQNGHEIYRHRKCPTCKNIFFTLEKPCEWDEKIYQLQVNQRNDYAKKRREKRRLNNETSL